MDLDRILHGFVDELSGRGAAIVLGATVGALGAWLVARWRRAQDRRRILTGDARETVVINHHLIETVDLPTPTGTQKAPAVLRIRTLGQGELAHVVPNKHLASDLLERARQVTPHDTLISMHDAEGSYLLETLTSFVCDRIGNESFEHDLYVMAPCCEPQELAHHQPITVLLISVKDLALFASWPTCRKIQVEHGSDGARILTLMAMAERFRAEQQHLAELRRKGERTQFVETMYVLDLALDQRVAPLPVKPVPWERFTGVLRQLGLESA
jgi:hypothetical protein